MRLPSNSYARRQKELTSIERDGAAFPPGDSHTTEKAVRDFRVQRVHKSPKNVSDDGLENAPPTRVGNRAQIRPVVGLISWSQKLNSWRRATDSNHQFRLPYHAVAIRPEVIPYRCGVPRRKLPIERVATKYRSCRAPRT